MDKATRTRFEAKREARKEHNRRTSVLRTTRISPQKARLVADQVRGLPVQRALDLLKFSDKKAAGLIYKVLFAAISNAENNAGDDVDELKVKTITVDEGPKALYGARQRPGDADFEAHQSYHRHRRRGQINGS